METWSPVLCGQSLWYEWDTSYNWAWPKKEELVGIQTSYSMEKSPRISGSFRKLCFLWGKKINYKVLHRGNSKKTNIFESPENIICFFLVTEVGQKAVPNSCETSCEISLHKQILIPKLILKIPFLPGELARELPVLQQSFVEHTICLRKLFL